MNRYGYAFCFHGGSKYGCVLVNYKLMKTMGTHLKSCGVAVRFCVYQSDIRWGIICNNF